jgi:hypothetical protein
LGIDSNNEHNCASQEVPSRISSHFAQYWVESTHISQLVPHISCLMTQPPSRFTPSLGMRERTFVAVMRDRTSSGVPLSFPCSTEPLPTPAQSPPRTLPGLVDGAVVQYSSSRSTLPDAHLTHTALQEANPRSTRGAITSILCTF